MSMSLRVFIRNALKSIGRSKTDVVRVMKNFHQKAFSDKYLLLTNITISSSLSSIGDVLEQQYEIYYKELEEWDRTRTSHMAVCGMSVGFICHYWYQILDSRLPGRSLKLVIQKVLLDQVIGSPIYISSSFITLGLMQNKTRHEVWDEVKDKGLKLYRAEWTVWPVAQFVNFYWLPHKYRISYDNTISLFYDVYTSRVKHSN